MVTEEDIKMCKHTIEPTAKTSAQLDEPPGFELIEVGNLRCFGPNWCAIGAIPFGAGCYAEEA